MLRRWKRATVAGFLMLAVALPTASAGPVTAPPAPATDPAPAPAPAPSPVFKDLPAEHWAYGAVQKLVQSGVVEANPQGLFRPEQPVQRSELFKMVLSARRKETTGDCQAMFRDVSCASWYSTVAENSYRMGIADGVGIDLFGPEGAVTRQQLFTIVVRGLGRRWEAANQGWSVVSSRLKRFTDSGKIAEWARPALALAVADGIAAGYTDGTFRPEATSSRAEAAALVSRILLPPDGLSTVKVDGRTVSYRQAFTMTASMYATGEAGVGQTTYTGMLVRVGAAAVDPTVIPLGKLLYVEGYGYAVAADIGGAIKGMRIDLFTFNYNDAALRFGMQPRKVWVLP